MIRIDGFLPSWSTDSTSTPVPSYYSAPFLSLECNADSADDSPSNIDGAHSFAISYPLASLNRISPLADISSSYNTASLASSSISK